MRKVAFLASAMICLGGSGAFAAADSTGCGLGTTLFEGQTGPVPQILAVTTNGTSGNQTFAITTGTLGCETQGTVRPANKRTAMFIGDNMNKVAEDMSRGDGESLRTLAALMGVEEQDRATFYKVAQANLDRVFPNDKVNAVDALDNLQAVMASDARLKRYVLA